MLATTATAGGRARDVAGQWVWLIGSAWLPYSGLSLPQSCPPLFEGREAERRVQERLQERVLAAGKRSQWPCWRLHCPLTITRRMTSTIAIAIAIAIAITVGLTSAMP